MKKNLNLLNENLNTGIRLAKGFYFGNSVEILTCSDCIFEKMLFHIQNAKKDIWVEAYIVSHDDIAWLFRRELIKASQRGCRIIFNYDFFGSVFRSSVFKNLRKYGIKVIEYNPITFFDRNRCGSFLSRNHRKLMIVDDHITICGSANIINNSYKRFRDTVLCVNGSVNYEAKKIAYNTFYKHFATDIRNKNTQDLIPEDGIALQTLELNNWFKKHTLRDNLMIYLMIVKRYCYISTPYFYPCERIKLLIINAARRGIEIIILTAGISDVKIMNKASQYIYEEYLRAGIKIYEVYGNTFHSKAVIMDDSFIMVGSDNLDWLSSLNLEFNLGVFSSDKAKELLKYFMEDLKMSQQITLSYLYRKTLLEKIFYRLCFYAISMLYLIYRRLDFVLCKVDF